MYCMKQKGKIITLQTSNRLDVRHITGGQQKGWKIQFDLHWTRFLLESDLWKHAAVTHVESKRSAG